MSNKEVSFMLRKKVDSFGVTKSLALVQLHYY